MALIIAFIAVFAVGNLSGWTVHSWKSGAKTAALESRDAVVTAANEQCKNDVVAVKSGVKDVTDALAKKKKDAEDSMKDARYWAAQHDRLAREVNSAPIRPDEAQCQAVEREQREYVERRHAAK